MKIVPFAALLFSVLCCAASIAAEVKSITNTDVIKMVKAELPETTIVLAIQNSRGEFDLSPDALIELKNAGVSAKIIEAMLTPHQPVSNASAPAADATAGEALPTAYGFYVVVDGKVLSFTPTQVERVFGLTVGGNTDRGVAVDGLPNTKPGVLKTRNFGFILYQRNVDPSSLKLALLMHRVNMSVRQFNLMDTRPEFFENVYGVSPYTVVDVNLWRPTAEIPLMVEPIAGHPDMYRLTPRGGFSHESRYAFYTRESLHDGDVIFAAGKGESTGTAYYFQYEDPTKLTRDGPLAAPITQQEFAKRVAAPAKAAPQPDEIFKSPSGEYTCGYPADLELRTGDNKSLGIFITRGAKFDEIDRDSISVFYQPMTIFRRHLNNQKHLAAEIEAIRTNTDPNAVILDAVPTTLAGEDALCFLSVYRKDGEAVIFAKTFAIGRKHIPSVSLTTTPARFEGIWEAYKRVCASYVALGK